MDSEKEADALNRELYGLFKYIQRVREEIAAIKQPAAPTLHFNSMGDQLDAILKATEDATHTIIECMEKNDEIVGKLREGIVKKENLALLDQICANSVDVFEACSFQDITGQRITKVVKSVTYVEDRVNALIEVWGKEEIEKIEVKPDKDVSKDGVQLHGPALEGEGITQAEIDKLFD